MRTSLAEQWWRLRWRLRARAFRRRPGLPFVLVYHRIGDTDRDPLALAVDPRRFEEHLDVLQRHTQPLDLHTLAARASRGDLPPNAVAVSFDDGYLDNLTVAAPLLRTKGIPATVFVATGLVEAQAEGWWDQLEQVFFSSSRVQRPTVLQHVGQSWSFPANSATAQERHAAFLDWAHRLARLSARAQASLLELARERIGTLASSRPERGFMTAAQVAACPGTGVLTVGAHTHSHPALSARSLAEQREEIVTSRQKLGSWLGHAPRLFAYPYGTYRDFNPATMHAVRTAGFDFAFANMAGRPSRGLHWQFPRVLAGNWGAAEFKQRLGLSA